MKKSISTMIYIMGALVTLCLSIIYLSHTKIILNPDAMLPTYLYEQAFVWLCLGFIPMMVASVAFYHFNHIRNSIHSRRNTMLVFIPCAICGCALIVLIGMIAVSFMNFNLMS